MGFDGDKYKNTPFKFFPGFPAQGLDILAGTARAHRSHVIGPKGLLDGADSRAVTGDDERAAALSAGERRSHWSRRMNVVFFMIVVDGG